MKEKNDIQKLDNEFKNEIKLLKKIANREKLLLIIIDKKYKNFYDSKKFNISIKTLLKEFNLKKEHVLIKDINDFSLLFISNIDLTPAYILFDNNYNVLWTGEGYFLPK